MAFGIKDTRLTPTARRLRHNSTEAERKFWQHVRNRQIDGYKIRRQFPVHGYVLDFACEELRFAIELDGGQHNHPIRQFIDTARTQKLESAGWQVARFWNNEVLENMEGVLTQIVQLLHARDASQGPSPEAPSGASTSPQGEVVSRHDTANHEVA
ncbi:MAG: endonuclease domain-containing protein [Rickettsiales bacterium]